MDITFEFKLRYHGVLVLTHDSYCRISILRFPPYLVMMVVRFSLMHKTKGGPFVLFTERFLSMVFQKRAFSIRGFRGFRCSYGYKIMMEGGLRQGTWPGPARLLAGPPFSVQQTVVLWVKRAVAQQCFRET